MIDIFGIGISVIIAVVITILILSFTRIMLQNLFESIPKPKLLDHEYDTCPMHQRVDQLKDRLDKIDGCLGDCDKCSK